MDFIVTKAHCTDVLLLAMEERIGKMDNKMMKRNPLLNYSGGVLVFLETFFCKNTSTKKLFRCGIQAEFFK